jgi:hypothetical protein
MVPSLTVQRLRRVHPRWARPCAGSRRWAGWWGVAAATNQGLRRGGVAFNIGLTSRKCIGLCVQLPPKRKDVSIWQQPAGGKGQARAPRPGGHRAAPAGRLAAQPWQRSHSALGAFFRRIAVRRGLAQASTATADTLARSVSALWQHGTASGAPGRAADETADRERVVRQVKRQAAAWGLVIVERDAVLQPL